MSLRSDTTWTLFWDMNSGGGRKEDPYDKIYIEAPEAEATVIFYNRFGHNPNRVSCTCCGSDYSISEGPLDQLTAYHRGCAYDWESDRYIEVHDKSYGGYRKYMTLDDYVNRDDVLCIPDELIEDHERIGDVPDEGYVWI